MERGPYAPPKSEVRDILPLPAGELVYAGFWRRFGAFWIDFAVLLPLMGIAYYFGEKTRLFQLYWFIPGLLFGLWYHVYLVARYGGTPGKLLLDMRIAMTDGSAVTTNAAALRYSVLFVLSVPVLAGDIGSVGAPAPPPPPGPSSSISVVSEVGRVLLALIVK